MIIDAHLHIQNETWTPNWFHRKHYALLSQRLRKRIEDVESEARESFDPSGDKTVEIMDKVGVDKAIACVTDFGLTDSNEDSITPIEEINRLTYEIVKRHPGRLYFAVGVDPRRKNALEIVETGVKEWGAKAVKLHPGTGWYPNDKIVYPLYQKCVELGVGVNFHTGPSLLKSKYTHPMHLGDVADDFPELTIHCTHSAHLQFMEMVGLARSYRNIILDLANWIRWLKLSRPTGIYFYQTVRFIMDIVGPRLMFASDWGGNPNTADYRDWVNAFTHIPDWVKEAGIEFTQKELDGYNAGNAIRLLHLEDKAI